MVLWLSEASGFQKLQSVSQDAALGAKSRSRFTGGCDQEGDTLGSHRGAAVWYTSIAFGPASDDASSLSKISMGTPKVSNSEGVKILFVLLLMRFLSPI
jgi:hypothetical protein